MNLGHLVSLLTLPSLAVAACPGVCGCAWVVRSSVCVCCKLGSVPLSASASAVFVPVPDSSAPPSLRRRSLSLPVPVFVAVPRSSVPLSVFVVCLSPFLSLRLHLLWLCLCLIRLLLRRFVCGYAWIVRSSVCVCCVPGSVPPSTSASTVCLCLCLVRRLLRLRLLCLWLCQKR